jgi:hypothetical protein
MKLYSLEAVEKVIAQASAADGEVRMIAEGALLDSYVISIPGKKHVVAIATYLNAWSSAYRVRQYNKLPKKYANL